MNLLNGALGYAEQGLHVFPLKPGQKVPATKHGCLDSTDDLTMVRAWWTAMPTANIGIACGPSQLAVVDVDGWNGTLEWAALRRDHGPTAWPAIVITPSGGSHWIYRADPARPIRNTASKLAPNVDTRAEGGYIVAAGSAVNGKRYRVNHVPDSVPVLPTWVADLLAPKPPAARPVTLPASGGRTSAYVSAALSGEVQRVLDSSNGTRHDTTRDAAIALGTLVGAGLLDEALAITALLDAAEAVGGDTSFTPSEIRRTIRDGMAYGIDRPRRVNAA